MEYQHRRLSMLIYMLSSVYCYIKWMVYTIDVCLEILNNVMVWFFYHIFRFYTTHSKYLVEEMRMMMITTHHYYYTIILFLFYASVKIKLQCYQFCVYLWFFCVGRNTLYKSKDFYFLHYFTVVCIQLICLMFHVLCIVK